MSSYLRNDDGLYVVLYLPSQVVWRRRGEPALTLEQRGSYPLDDAIAMRVSAPHPVRMRLRLRIPAWAGPSTRIAVNGRAMETVAHGRFAVIEREWRDGDRIGLWIDRTLRLEQVDERHSDRVALVQWPLALFATADRFEVYRRERLVTLRQVAAGSSEWRLDGENAATFRPWFGFDGGPYRLYQRVV